VHPALLDDDALARLADDLAALGATARLQPFRTAGCIDAELIGSANNDKAQKAYGAAAGRRVR
jgi:pyruvate formate lyase activating enzyme